ncbi:SBBP repeat-containing protein [Fluviicola taffensis]|uniref:DUF7948 domain-containing protein n=1 Tax=Fluviicola taffensis TaxID=191579 RepID=UPI0031378615
MKRFRYLLILVVFGHFSFITLSQEVPKSEFLLNSIQTAFEENKGQVTGSDADQVKYTFNKGGLKLFLLKTGLAYQFTKIHLPEGQHPTSRHDHFPNGKLYAANDEKFRTETYRMDLKLINANQSARITTEGKSTEFVNYYNHQALDVHSYTRVIYHDIYPNIDWVIYTKNESVKYDFIVHPGGDPTRIQFESVWAEEIQLTADGSLVLSNRMGKITEQTPVSFQRGKTIGTHFNLSNTTTIGFDVDSYDKTIDLIIDPTIVWGTYYGGEVYDYAYSVKVDDSGNIFISGESNSTTAIASGGYQNTLNTNSTDVMLVKFNSSGVRQWATYLGGNMIDDAFSSAIDPSGNVYICGRANSSTGIAFAGHQNTQAGSEDGFLAKFSTIGSLLWSTYYGGSNLDQLKAVDTDALGNVFVVGFTLSTSDIATVGSDQPTYGGGFLDAFIVKFNADGIRQWATYYGGSGMDRGLTCNVDINGDVYVGGFTVSTNGISSGGFQNTYGGGGTDGYLAKFNTNGVRIWATYYGGSSDESVETCTTDLSGNVFIGGSTQSTSGIASSGFQNTITSGSEDAFLAKFDSNGQRLWGTYYGGSAVDIANSCVTDDLGNCYLTGTTSSSTGIASMGMQNTHSGDRDGMIVKFDPNGTRLWGSYLGGTSYDEILGGTVDLNNNIYICGYSNSLAGIATGGTHQTSRNVGPDAFLVKINDITPCTPTISITSAQGATICSGTSVDFTAAITNGGGTPIYQWKKNGVNVGSNSSVFSTSSLTSGDVITCELTSNAACATPASVLSSGITMTVNPTVVPTISITSVQGATICSGTSVDFTAAITNGGGTPTYQWKKNGVNVGSNSSVFSTSSLTSGDVIMCELTSNAACATPASVLSSGITMTVNSTVVPTISITSAQGTTICSGTSVDFSATIANGGGTSTYQWKKNGVNVGSNSSVFSTSSLTSGDVITCELTSNATCASSTTALSSGISMTVNIALNVTVSVNGITLTSNQIGASYQWIDCDGMNQAIPGATAESYTPTSNGSYSVVVSFSNTCVDTSDCIVINTLGLKEQDLENELEVYPNPSQGVFFIASRRAIKAIIIDGLGKVITNIDLKKGTNQIDLSTQARGVYYIQLDASSQHQKVQLIINN